MEYSGNLLFALVLLSIVLHGYSVPISRRSRAAKISDETSPNSQDVDSNEELATSTQEPRTRNNRKNKALNLLNYFPSFLSSGLDYNDEDDDDVTFAVNDDTIDEEDLSRTIPSKRQQQNKRKNGAPNTYNNKNDNLNSLQYDNSPIFFIRLPPTPYMFVPGVGYVSQPPSLTPPMPQPQVNDPFINLPIDFVSNGKPIGVYQWNGDSGYPQVPQAQPQMPNVGSFGYGSPAPRPSYNAPSYSKPKPKPKPKPAATNSKVTNLKGPFVFNGKPSDSVYVLRDTYNSIYSDALQNFYP